MNMNDTKTLNRRLEDRFQAPAAPLQWEGKVRKRRADDFIPPEQPLDWSDAEPNHQRESYVAAIVALLVSMPSIIRQARCSHGGPVRENSACDAICSRCGKNLGFIGTLRKKRATKEA